MTRKVVYSTANRLIGFTTESEIHLGEKIVLYKDGYNKDFEILHAKKLTRDLTQIKNSNITIVLENLYK